MEKPSVMLVEKINGIDVYVQEEAYIPVIHLGWYPRHDEILGEIEIC